MILFLCTKATPWDKVERPGQQVQHADAHEVGEQQDGWPGGDIVRMQCPHCGQEWKEELPQ